MTEQIELTDNQCLRWRQLTAEAAASEWWQTVFEQGGFVAGGAALFVADAHQCLKNVTDIDVWASVEPLVILGWIKTLCEEYKRYGRFYRVYTGSTVTVYTERTIIQFIRLPPNQGPPDILPRFDMTYTQVAIAPTSAPAPSTTGMVIVSTAAAREAWATRFTRWTSRRILLWHPMSFDSDSILNNYNQRLEKMSRKGFSLSLPVMEDIAHECLPTHRRDASGCVLAVFDTIDESAILTMPIFDEHNYQPHPSVEYAELKRLPYAGALCGARGKHRFVPYAP